MSYVQSGTTRAPKLRRESRMDKTWNDAAAKWLRHRETKWVGYEDRYLKRLDEFLDGMPIADIRRADVVEIRDTMLEEGKKPATVNRYLTVLRSILIKARDDWEWVDKVPKIERLREEERVHFITKAQAKRLCELLPKHLERMVRFTLATGLRSSNVRNLKWSHIDLSRQLMSIPGSEMKNGRDFVTPLNSMAIEVLKSQRDLHEDFVFVYRGKPVKQCNTRAFRDACAKAGIQGTRFHDLRHTWASWHVQSGTHTAKLRELGGWSNDQMVQRYAHLGREHLLEEVQATTF